MGMYQNYEINGELMVIRTNITNTGKNYANGIIASYEINEKGNKTKWFSIPFISFEEPAIKLEMAKLEKGDRVFMRGYLTINKYKEKETTQLVATEVIIGNKTFQSQPQQQTTQTQTQDQSVTMTDDDFPF